MEYHVRIHNEISMDAPPSQRLAGEHLYRISPSTIILIEGERFFGTEEPRTRLMNAQNNPLL
eukprot:scaffold683_cov164-Amphora_coffeaeformis.AAC.6